MALIKVKERGRETVNLGRRNLIINGAMQVAQRGTSSTGISAGGYYTVDRYRLAYNGSPDELRFTQEKSTDAPEGFANSLKLTVTTAETTLAADERVRLQQRIEGQNLQNLKYGTSNAEYLTISFYVKSNVTGTYGIHLNNADSTRSVCPSYTIDAANTWEKKTISVAGDTTGTFTNDNGRSLDFCWTLAAGTNYTSGTLATSWEASTNANEAPSGQPNLISTVNNTWQITGVQLELGSTATDFEHRLFGEELPLCQRYCAVLTSPSGQFMYRDYYSTDTMVTAVELPVTMRTTPSITMTGSGGTSNTGFFYTNLAATPTLAAINPQAISVYRGVASSARTYIYMASTGELTMEAEL